ncbi:MAG: hypothetical protein ABIK92_13780 [Pseudomonadota bacterium]
MRKTMVVYMLICCLAVLVSCRHQGAYVPYTPDPQETWSYSSITSPVVTNDYTISIVPEYWGSYRRNFGWQCFALSVENKTDKNIEIVWDKTLFVTKGSTSGRFMFDGVIYKDRNNPKPNDIVFGNTTLTKLILPNNLLEYIRGSSMGWLHNIIPQGETGIYITIKIDEKEIGEKVIVNISKE